MRPSQRTASSDTHNLVACSNHQQIAAVLQAKGHSRRSIFPMWYRAHRMLGIRICLPVLMNMAEHYYYVGVQTALITTVAYGVMTRLEIVSRFPISVLVFLVLFVPFTSWYRYRKARRDLKSEGLLS